MEKDLQDKLDNINNNIKDILIVNTEIKMFKQEQNKINNVLFKDLSDLSHRMNKSELTIETLNTERHYMKNTISDLNLKISKIEESNNKIISGLTTNNERFSNLKETTDTFKKIFFALLSLNFSFLIAISIYFINSI